MIKTVTVTNYLGERMVLDLYNPKRSGFSVKSISGLGPVKANINTTEIATSDGSLYNSARLNERNITISLGFEWMPLIEDARHKSYQFFPLKKPVTLVIETDRRIVQTTGYVESNEPDIFSNSEGSTISIICPDPGLYPYGDDAITRSPFYVITPMFEFPFENDSLEEPLLEFGNIESSVTRSIWYDGDEEVGMRFIINVYGAVKNITFRNVRTRESIFFDTDKFKKLIGTELTSGDQVIISTVKGEKGASLIRNGIVTNILNCIDRNADWFVLSKGENIINYSAEEGETNVEIVIENQTIYSGV